MRSPVPKPNHDIGVEHQVMDRVQAALMIIPKRVVEHCETIIPEQIVISDYFRQSSFGSRLGWLQARPAVEHAWRSFDEALGKAEHMPPPR